jgi:hypothetical protein
MGLGLQQGIFVKGDSVVVFSVTILENGEKKINKLIAKVVAAGATDLFLRCEASDKIFRRPQEFCRALPHFDPPLKLPQVVVPHIGDLVMSIVERWRAEESRIGILMEILDLPPKQLSAKILCGEETHVVPWDSIIVMEPKSNV